MPGEVVVDIDAAFEAVGVGFECTGCGRGRIGRGRWLEGGDCDDRGQGEEDGGGDAEIDLGNGLHGLVLSGLPMVGRNRPRCVGR